ncbi:unnamed protein product [Durusdinium trenchii]|uniref:Uncharacterized protein n=1 Tax=Durusdinium trenchii TaxID=1381693 RepID=A0ABP0SW75_9DINO
MPQESMTIRAEVMQYDGVRDSNWYFPLQDFIPKRGNHTAYESQSRRSCENGAITLGLNAEDFSDSAQDLQQNEVFNDVLPVSQLLCHITMSIEPPTVQRSNREGHSFVLLSLGGWPFRVRRIGTFEGLGDHGRVELSLGSGDFNEEALWQLLGECQMGGKYWCQLLELDWLGPKKDDQLVIDSEIPLEKGYIWFRVLCAESSGTALRVELLEDGVVPAWLDLRFLQVWAGDIPLGYLNKADVVYVENSAGHLVFDDPLRCSANQLVDLGWSIHEVCYRSLLLHAQRRHPCVLSPSYLGSQTVDVDSYPAAPLLDEYDFWISSFFKLEGLPLSLTVVKLDNSRLELRIVGLDCPEELQRLEVGSHIDQTFELTVKKKIRSPIKDFGFFDANDVRHLLDEDPDQSLVLEMRTFFISQKQASAAGHLAQFSHMEAVVGTPEHSHFVTWMNVTERTWTIDRVFLNDVLPAGNGYGGKAISEHLLVVCDVVNWNTYMLMAVAGSTTKQATDKLGDVLGFALQSELQAADLTRAQLSEWSLLDVFQRTVLGKMCSSVIKRVNNELKHNLKTLG